MAFSIDIKKSRGGDEYYSPRPVVEMIAPYVMAKGFKKIWCPFDTKESEFVKVFKELGCDVTFGHISTGQNFFDYDTPQGEVIVSNPPFSKRDAIFEKIYKWHLPFALVTNFNGLFNSRKRAQLFREHPPEILIPYGRMKFFVEGEGGGNSQKFPELPKRLHLQRATRRANCF